LQHEEAAALGEKRAQAAALMRAVVCANEEQIRRKVGRLGCGAWGRRRRARLQVLQHAPCSGEPL
jgi:hypothetical protein